ncbi:restriction endonuclease subunit S [Planococcus sp. APC 4015]|nr:restriction endonuclease subunit S [Planococcus sp. APC 4015]
MITVKHGYAFPGAGFGVDETSPQVLTPANFGLGGGFQSSKPKSFAGDFPPEFLLSGGELVVTMTDLSKAGDTLGFAARLPRGQHFLHNQRIGLIRVTAPDQLDIDFFHYLTRTDGYRSHILGTASGSTVKHTSPGRIGDFTTDVPPLLEQQAIAEVLGALDDNIAANNVLVERLLAVVHAEFSRRFHDRSLNVPLGALAEVVDCLHSKKPERIAKGATLMQLNNIRDDGLVDRVAKYSISAADYAEWSKRFETRAWDFVITNVGRIGAVARIPKGFTAALGRNMTGIRPNELSASGSFIAAALHSRAVRREVDERTDAGSVMNALNVRSVPLLRLQDSTHAERSAFHQFAAPLYESADVALVSNTSLAATRDALLPQLMSGKLRVRDAEAVASSVGA